MSELYFHLSCCCCCQAFVADGWQINVSNLLSKSKTLMLIWWTQTETSRLSTFREFSLWQCSIPIIEKQTWINIDQRRIKSFPLLIYPPDARGGRNRFVRLTEAERLAQTIISEWKLRFPQSLLARLPIASFARGLDGMKLLTFSPYFRFYCLSHHRTQLKFQWLWLLFCLT